MHLISFTDGGARGNPGPAAIGVVLQNDRGKKIITVGKYIGTTTNNQAEYQALVLAVELALKHGATALTCYLDSELVVKQMKREYRVRDLDLQPHFVKIWNLAQKLKPISFHHVPRAENKTADALVNQALDQHLRLQRS